MRMLKAILIDDEADAISALQMMLTTFCEGVDIIGTSQSALEGVKLIHKEKPDIVFLDIEMPNANGFEVLELVQERDFYLIFVTAYEEYAIKALRTKADNYLLKPLNPNELKNAISEIKEQIKEEQNCFDILENKIALPLNDGFRFVEMNDIEWIEASDNYSYVHHISGERLIVCRKLKSFENSLKDHGFLRVHRSHIINLKYLQNFSKAEGGFVKTSSGKVIYLPKRNKDEIIKTLKNHTIGLN